MGTPSDRMSKRRTLIVALGTGVFLAPVTSLPQQQKKVYRIGILASDSLETRGPSVEIFIRAMRELGYVEGRNILYEARYAGGDFARLDALGAELAGQNLDVIVVPNGRSVEAAARAADLAKRPVPVVFSSWAEPLRSGRVASLARPGGNVTGVTNVTLELAGKQLQLLKDAVPKISRIAAFVDLTLSRNYFDEVERAGKALGMQTLLVDVRSRDDVEPNVAVLRKWGADSIFVANNPTNFNNRKLLVQIFRAGFASHPRLGRAFRVAQMTRLPAVYGNDVYAETVGS
jgi:putative tryptophan/tyrosine transport system substrate-binding protein